VRRFNVTQLGESVSVDLALLDAPPQPGALKLILTETSSSEPIAGVEVNLSGTSTASAETDDRGEVHFTGLAPGPYQATLEQAEFQMVPDEVPLSVTSGEEETAEIEVSRVMLTLTLKRIHIQGLWKAVRGDKNELEYGHWWIEIDGSESYGWWPAEGVGLWGTFTGVKGILNGQTPRFRGTATRDPHHGDEAEEMFHPTIRNGKPAGTIKSCIRGFAHAYTGSWSWPWGQNCHSFQEALMGHCRLSKHGSKKAT
jgi:hypothetical protein